jgi:hypothetical protein
LLPCPLPLIYRQLKVIVSGYSVWLKREPNQMSYLRISKHFIRNMKPV